MAFTITAEGTVSDPYVERSSGYPELDKASLDCVKTWRYRPATEDGHPVAAHWEANVQWRNAGVDYAETPRDCRSYYRVTTLPAGNVGYTIVEFQTVGGNVTSASVLQSSGDSRLDSYAVECVKSIKMMPIDDRGNSSDSHYGKVVWWRDRRPDDPYEK
jgi:protein TonB